MAITQLPAVPTRTDTPANFTIKADAFLGALPQLRNEINADLSAIASLKQRQSKNLIINGNFHISQRKTSGILTNGAFIADRMKVLGSVGDDTYNVIHRYGANVLATVLDEYTYIKRLTGTSTEAGPHQHFEVSSFIPAGTKLTMSFNYKSVLGANTATVVSQYRHNGLWADSTDTLISAVLNLVDGKNTFTFTTTVDYQKGDVVFKILISSTAPWTFGIKEWQVEFGSIATDFEQRHIAEEIALCQRYFETSYNIHHPVGSNFNIGTKKVFTNDNLWLKNGSFNFSVAKRITPNIKVYSLQGLPNVWSEYFTGGTFVKNIVMNTTDACDNSFTLYSSNGSFTPIRMLMGHWIADAEIY